MLALVPGTSRSGATIIGGMLFGLSRPGGDRVLVLPRGAHAVAAGAYDLYKHRSELGASDIGLFSVGLAAAFVSAFLCVRWLLRYVARNTFKRLRVVPDRVRRPDPRDTWYLKLVDWTEG